MSMKYLNVTAVELVAPEQGPCISVYEQLKALTEIRWQNDC
jgi:hypothetical protein